MENVLNDAIRTALTSNAVSIAEFDEVVRRHQKRVYRVLFVLLRDPDAAQRIALARARADATTKPLIERERLFK